MTCDRCGGDALVLHHEPWTGEDICERCVQKQEEQDTRTANSGGMDAEEE